MDGGALLRLICDSDADLGSCKCALNAPRAGIAPELIACIRIQWTKRGLGGRVMFARAVRVVFSLGLSDALSLRAFAVWCAVCTHSQEERHHRETPTRILRSRRLGSLSVTFRESCSVDLRACRLVLCAGLTWIIRSMDRLEPAAEGVSPALHTSTASPTQQQQDAAAPVAPAPWVGTQLQVVAVTGLAPSHSAPLTRVLYQMPMSRGCHSTKRSNTSNRLICLDNEASSARYRQLQREPNGRFTASWDTVEDGDDDEFLLPPALNFVEIQVWNQFPNGFDVFLGMATLAISSLYWQQEQQQVLNNHGQGTSAPAILQTPLMWIPLQASNDSQPAATAQMNLSVQLRVTFLCDAKASRICQQVAQRAKRKENQPQDDTLSSIADPTFAFTKPLQPIDWSAIVTASVRHIFFHVSPAFLQLLSSKFITTTLKI